MKKMYLTAGLIAALAAGAAQAQSLGVAGGELEFSANRNTTFGFNQSQLNGSVVLNFGAGFSTQVDFGSSRVPPGPASVWTVGVHLIYTISQDMIAGMYYAQDRASWIPDVLTNYGVELAYVTGKISMEAQIGKTKSPGYSASVASIGGSYDLGGNFSANAGTILLSDPFGSVRQLSLGGEYAFGNGMNAGVTYYSRNWSGGGSDRAIGIKIGYEFGKGSTFGRRGYFQQRPAF